jgi:hypothetical protein
MRTLASRWRFPRGRSDQWDLQEGISALGLEERVKCVVMTAIDEALLSLDKDFFNTLIKINFHNIDRCSTQMKSEARGSFWLAGTISAVGAIFIGMGVTSLLHKGTIAASMIVISTGILVDLLGALFFHWHSRIVMKMANYQQKLALVQNVNLALKTAEELPEKEKAYLVKELLQDINKLLAAGSGDQSALR